VDAMAEALRRAVQRVLETEPGARLACVTVLKTSRIGVDLQVDADGRSLHVQRLVELKHWARPLRRAPDRITYHVLQAPDAADALVHHARNNHVDHIVIGARGSSALRRYLGSVSAQVVAEAPCTVTVFRRPDAQHDDRATS
jgi:eukaryotic-like serine/threonine-protein kinase